MLGAYAQTGVVEQIFLENPSLIIAIIFGVIVYIGLNRSSSLTWKSHAPHMALVLGFGLFLLLTFGAPQQAQSFYTGVDISRIMPVLVGLVPLLIIVALVVKLGKGGDYGSKGLSWKLYCFFIGIAMIAGATIVSNFMNQPTMTTPLLAIGVLLVIVALVGSLAGLKGTSGDIYRATSGAPGKGKHKITIFINWSDNTFADNSEWRVYFQGKKKGNIKKSRHEKCVVLVLPGGVYDFWAEPFDKKHNHTNRIQNHTVNHQENITLISPLAVSTSTVQHQLMNLSQYLHGLAANVGQNFAGQQIHQAADALQNLANAM